MDTPTPSQIIAARHAAGHTQTVAAHTVFAALRTWQDWEAGKYKMPPERWLLYLILTRQISISSAIRLVSDR
ncbi:MAG: YdiL family protein [Burkholderiales bacterium]|jgi:DNA-binding transcriptional regulator YiaG|nr:YdiL family protein [Burkholderiales bacterium]